VVETRAAQGTSAEQETVNPPEEFPFYRAKRVMITGGLGFIGSNLARRLVDLGADVLLMDSLAPDSGANLFNIDGIESRLRLEKTDIGDAVQADRLIRDRDILFNLAARTGHLQSMQDPLSDLDTNCRGQLVLLEACRKSNPGIRIVYTSTRQIYGHSRRLPVDETHPLEPPDLNGIHKLACEQYHLLYHRIYNLPSVVLRLTNVYGPRMRIKDSRGHFLGWWIRQILDGQPLAVYGDGRQIRDLNYIDDTVDALLLAGENTAIAGEIFNLGSQEPVRLIDLARMLIEINGSGVSRLQLFPRERRQIETGDYYADIAKAQKGLGWSPRTALRDGLEKTLAYFRENRGRYA
jgi:UDP-glucose 4-epimerase